MSPVEEAFIEYCMSDRHFAETAMISWWGGRCPEPDDEPDPTRRCAVCTAWSEFDRMEFDQ
jgi:hypothetical protein